MMDFVKWVNSTQASLMVIQVMCLGLMIQGCATLGIGTPSREQAALEGVAGIMVAHYFADLQDDDALSELDIANALIAKGDDYLAKVYPQDGWTVMGLLSQFATQISGGKVSPNVGQIYYLVTGVLESLEE